MAMIEISNLMKTYGDTMVLENINLEIEKGDVYGLVGVSGAGKSTLLRCINGLEHYDRGSLIVDGTDLKKLDKEQMRQFRRGMGMIFQQFSLLERKTVYENVAFPMKCWGYAKEEIDRKVRQLLELVELGDKADRKPRTLSGGQKQRVAIARALTLDPKVLLCDEATSALDPNITKSILELLRKINQEMDITMIVVTHQMSVVKQVCNKMSILSQGKLMASGKVEDIFLDKPPILYELLGEEQGALPKDGVNLEILRRDDRDGGQEISQMAIDTQVPFSIVWGNLDRYRDDIRGSFVIHCEEKDAEKLTAYLEEKQMEYKKL